LVVFAAAGELLVGDVYPQLGDQNEDGDSCDFGEFGDDALTWGDVIAVFDAWALPGSFPCDAGTDRHCAMDSYPVPGGDCSLSWGDVITTFDRWADPFAPEVWRNLCDCPCSAASVESAEAIAPEAVGEEAQAPVLWVDDRVGVPGRSVRLPVRVDLGDWAADRIGFSVALEPAEGVALEAELVEFEAAGALGEPLVLATPDGGLAVAWLEPMEKPLTGTKLLGRLVARVPAEAQPGDAWTVSIEAAGAALGQAELAPMLSTAEDALLTVRGRH
jgi:hypothetical protein